MGKPDLLSYVSFPFFSLGTKDHDQLIFINSQGRETLHLAHAAYTKIKELINKVRVLGQPGWLGYTHHCNCK